ncbi:MAG: histidine--tRNA ligase [Omnitrophica bacterium]|nr:histidine--tRNA ligase [Candidatus Omnitrophota bacterium]
MKYKAVRGMEDILPGDVGIWRWLEDNARRVFDFFGYEEIRTPILEETSVFSRSIGETSDIVTKEMYTFKDRKERSLTLRPEGTAPIVRAYIEHSMDKLSSELKLYYIGPMFRSERPQKGRLRQFHQIGVEIFGGGPYSEVLAIRRLEFLLRSLGLRDFTIKLNSLGCKTDKDSFAGKMKKYLKDKEKRLCDDCKVKIKRNVLRVLDCKNECCIQVVRQAPDILDSLCTECGDRFDKLKKDLKDMEVPFAETKNLVRGLDYYTGTIFEITHPALGAQDAIGAGGRYDNLVKDLGGPDINAFGYALGMERIILILKKTKSLPEPKTVYVATLGTKAKYKGAKIVAALETWLLRKEWKREHARVMMDGGETSLKSQMRKANKNNAKIVVILGEDEVRENKAILRNMVTKEQRSVSIDNVAKEIEKELEKH